MRRLWRSSGKGSYHRRKKCPERHRSNKDSTHLPSECKRLISNNYCLGPKTCRRTMGCSRECRTKVSQVSEEAKTIRHLG